MTGDFDLGYAVLYLGAAIAVLCAALVVALTVLEAIFGPEDYRDRRR